MRPRTTAAFLLCALLAGASPAGGEDAPPLQGRLVRSLGVELDNSAAAARQLANETIGSFSNEGYRLRDAFLSGDILPGEKQLVEINVFAGNQYWVVLAVHGTGVRPRLRVFDGSGKPVSCLPLTAENVTGAGFVPETSGMYFLEISLHEGPAAPFCLMYAVK